VIPQLDITVLDLGKDRERINAADALRQTATVNHLLKAFFGPRGQRREVQILADEVGMGKTYVALAVAYSMLSVLRDTTQTGQVDDLDDCYRCVLVITPGGSPTLAEKWDREDEALLTRCGKAPEKTAWFQSLLCESSDQLLQAILRADDLRRRGNPVILVAQSSIFTKKLSDPAVRFLTACLFRWWGNCLQMRDRYNVIRGLAETVGSGEWGDAAAWRGRGEYEIDLWDWRRHGQFLTATDRDRQNWEPAWERRMFSQVSIGYADMVAALDRFARDGGAAELESLRQRCQNVPQRCPADQRTSAYREYVGLFRSLKRGNPARPIVEPGLATLFKHLWGYLLQKKFPLVISDEAHHWRNNEAGDFRAIRDFVAPFARRMLLLTATPFQLSPLETVSVLKVIEPMRDAIGPERVEVLVRLRDRLSTCMGASERIGKTFSREWGALAEQLARWDPRYADGATFIKGESDPRTTCIARLWAQLTASNTQEPTGGLAQVPGALRPFFTRALELRQANRALRTVMRELVVRHRRSTQHRRYWVGREHPKLRRVVHEVLSRWDRGEKSLLFCFRVPTAKALHVTLRDGIAERLRRKRVALLRARGTEAVSDAAQDKAMQQFRRALTTREGSGISLFLDRVLIGWLLQRRERLPELTTEDLRQIALLAARATHRGQPLFEDWERPDRVFLHRTVEHVWARRLLASPLPESGTVEDQGRTRDLLLQMAEEAWVRVRYGVPALSARVDADQSETDRVARSSMAASYELEAEAGSKRSEKLIRELLSRYRGGRGLLLTALVAGPNLFGACGPALQALDPASQEVARQISDALLAVTVRAGNWDWSARRDAVDAVIRAILRDDLLLRMPTSVFRGRDDTWAEALFAGLHQPINADHHGETLAQRLVALLRELARMSEKERSSYLGYAMNAKAEAAVLVDGNTKPEYRDAIFCGFNTPLLPEILICTAVGQEGIDLHRECRHVIHYDLGWNPASIEQRTGRADRIGSKTERERNWTTAANPVQEEARLPGLDVALPYLAATYDERMFDVLRTRAQVFEILTGGDPTADRDSETMWLSDDEEGSEAGIAFVPLPQEMLDDLKVDLSLWRRDAAPLDR